MGLTSVDRGAECAHMLQTDRPSDRWWEAGPRAAQLGKPRARGGSRQECKDSMNRGKQETLTLRSTEMTADHTSVKSALTPQPLGLGNQGVFVKLKEMLQRLRPLKATGQ